MDNEQAQGLLRKYNSGQCTDSEKALIEKSFFDFNEHEIEISLKKLQEFKKEVSANLPKSKSKINRLTLPLAISTAAAVMIIAIYIFLPSSKYDTAKSIEIAGTIFPKGNVAMITMSDGKTIQLDQKKNEIEVGVFGITYKNKLKVSGIKPTEYQTISTPNGGEYKIVLSDGTKVWLNAATVLQYPTSFRERTQRRVKLISGEAYFEVSKDKVHPFIVSTRNQNITVLGTSFNIKAYSQNIKTTLLEGSVKLELLNSDNHSNNALQLKPGEQSISEGQNISKEFVDTNLEVAWRNGKIKFRDASLFSILSEAERWYNIEVHYNGKVPKIYLTGGISRKSNLATLLELLKLSSINFSMKEQANKNILTIESHN